MENNIHRLIVVDYELYSVENGKETFIEKTEGQKPMQFYTGCEMTIPAFEEEIVRFETDSDFAFSLEKARAYGEYDPKSVLALDKTTFIRDGVFDEETICKDAVIPLQNQEGQRFLGKVLNIGDEKVTIDLNHPLAGKDLRFKGHVLQNREASEEEVRDFFEQMNQHHCSGGCGGCGGDCGEHKHEHGDGEHCCGKHGHGEGECCGGGHGEHKHEHGKGEHCCGKHGHGEGECCGGEH